MILGEHKTKEKKTLWVLLVPIWIAALSFYGHSVAQESSSARYDSMFSSPKGVIRFMASEELSEGKAEGIDTATALNMLIEALRSEISTPAPDNKAIGTYVSGTEFLKTNYAIAIGKLSVGHEGVLKAHLGNATGEYRQRLLFILGFLRDESVHGEIATIFKESHDSYIRLAAITALGEYRDTLDVPTLETALYDSFYVYDFLDEAGKPINMWYPVKNVATSALLKMGYDVVWKDNKYIITRRE